MIKIGIRGRLLLLALGVALPLALAGLVALRAIWATSQDELKNSLSRQAELAAVAYERWLSAYVQTVNAIAARLRRWPDLADLQNNLRVIASAGENWLDVRVVDDMGAVVMQQPAGAAPFGRDTTLALLAQAKQQGSWAALADSGKDGRPRAIAVGRLLDRGGAVILRVDTVGLAKALENVALDEQRIIAAYGALGRPLFQSRGVAADLAAAEHRALLSSLHGRRSTVIETVSDADGVPRVYALARAGATGSIIVIGVPSESLYQPARVQLRRYVLFSLLAVFSAIVAAITVARRIATPVRRLRGAAAQFGAGDFRARAAVEGGGEIAALAVTFNRMADLIEEREAKLSELDRLKSFFVSSVSHELRTPLTTIKTLTRVLLRKQVSDEDRREYLETIATECDRQIDLVVNLLDLSRIETGHTQPCLQSVDAAAVARDCVNSRRTAAEQRQQALLLDLPAKLPPVLADRAAMRRVIDALLDNAIKYTPEGGRITVTARLRGKELGIIVSDSGLGIHARDLPRIFDKFYRGQPAVGEVPNGTSCIDVPGVGLGLYLARTITEQLGGQLEVETAPGKGSTFTMWLPLAPAAHQGDVVRQEA